MKHIIKFEDFVNENSISKLKSVYSKIKREIDKFFMVDVDTYAHHERLIDSLIKNPELIELPHKYPTLFGSAVAFSVGEFFLIIRITDGGYFLTITGGRYGTEEKLIEDRDLYKLYKIVANKIS